MGADAARITAADFLTPPELAAWSLAADGAGRIGGVRLTINSDGNLGACYQQVPLRVLPAFRFGAGRPSLVYLLNPTAGLMDGDAQLVELRARAGSRTVVVGQSATRIHPAVRGFCTQQWRLHVEAGAVLVVLPGPAIPFADCRYYQRVDAELEAGAHLIWGDIWTAGRYARGAASEQFRFRTVIQDLAIRRHGTLIYRDRFCWQGPWDDATAAWHFAGAPACGSLFATGAPDPAPPPGCAVFPTAYGDHCIRWHGPAGTVSDELVRAALTIAARHDGATDPWLLGEADLAPNHWFSPAPTDAREMTG